MTYIRAIAQHIQDSLKDVEKYYDDNKKGMSEFFRNALNIYTKE